MKIVQLSITCYTFYKSSLKYPKILLINFFSLIINQAKKIAEHERNKQRRKEEKEINEKKERIKKAREAREKAAEEAKKNPQEGGMPGGMDGLGGLGTADTHFLYTRRLFPIIF